MIIVKVCTKCSTEKNITDFSKNKTTKDGLNYWCKSCIGNYAKKYNKTEERKKVVKAYKKEYIKTEKHKEYIQKYNKENKKKYRNLEKEKEYAKKYRNSENGKLAIKKLNKNYCKTNKRKEYLKNYIKTRREKDPLYKLKTNIKSAIFGSFKKNGYEKGGKTNQILGCSFYEFKRYLESKFESWMNWDNYGVYKGDEKTTWQIDHIRPISLGKTEEEIIRLSHYTNLQPLDSYINLIIKRNKIY